VQDEFDNRVAAANLTCSLRYYSESNEQLPKLSDACTPLEGDDSGLTAASYAPLAGVYQIVIRLQQPGGPQVELAGEIFVP